MKYLLCFLFTICIANANEQICVDIPIEQNQHQTTTSYCDASGNVIRIESIYNDTLTIAYLQTFKADIPHQVRRYTKDGTLIKKIDYEAKEDNSIIKTEYDTDFSPPIENFKLHYLPRENSPLMVQYKITQWFYLKTKKEDEEAEVIIPLRIDHYDQQTQLVHKREQYYADGSKKIFFYHYDDNNDLISFDAFTDDNKPYRHYDPQELDLKKIYDKNQTKTPFQIVSVIDSDFDLTHPSLQESLYAKREEPVDQIDQDENGVVDDFFGFNLETLDNNVLPQLDSSLTSIPRSHGTHTASIVVTDKEDISLMLFSNIAPSSSDPNIENLSKVARQINRYGIRFNNMSFSFFIESYLGKINYDSQVYLKMKSFIEETPDTLHIVAAGNDRRNIDLNENFLVPAALPNENIITVGALKDWELKPEHYPTQIPYEETNFGIENVDILAPGYYIEGADIGGGTTYKSGTSMASPVLINIAVLPILRANPRLRNNQIKEIILKTAYTNLEALQPVKCGGIVNPTRAIKVAHLMHSRPWLTVEKAVLSVRKKESQVIVGEKNSNAYLRKLTKFWKQRNIIKTGL